MLKAAMAASSPSPSMAPRPAASPPQNPMATARWMQRTLTGPMGAATSSPTPMPASTSWMPDRTICAPDGKCLSLLVDADGKARPLGAKRYGHAAAVRSWQSAQGRWNESHEIHHGGLSFIGSWRDYRCLCPVG